MFVELISIIIAFIFLLYYSGIGLTRLIIPERFKDYELLVIPFIGLSVVLFFAHIFSLASLGSRTFTWLILAIITPLNIYAVKRNGVPHLNLFETLPVFVIAGIVFLVGMLPLFYEGYLTVVGINGDAAYYTMLADHFLTNGLTSPTDKGSWFTNIVASLLGPMKSRVGPMYFQSMIGAVTGLEGYKLFTVIINLFRSILLFSTYVFLRSEDLLSRKASLFAIALLGTNSLLYWLAIDGYLAQMMMVSALPLALTSSFFILTDKGHKSLAFSAAISSIILMTSPESIILLLGPFSLFIIIKVIRKELFIKDAIKSTLFWLFVLALLNVVPLKVSFLWFYNLITVGFEKGLQVANGGNVHYFIPITQVFGFTPPYHYFYREITDLSLPLYRPYFYASYVVSFTSLLLTGYVLLRSDRQRQTTLVAITVSYILMAIYLRLTFPYGYFKIASTVSFFTAALMVMGIGMISSGSFTRAVKIIFLPVTALIVVLTLISSYILFDMVINDDTKEWITINKGMITLKGVQRHIKKEDPILIQERFSQGSTYLWIAYLMQDREVMTRKAPLPATEAFREKNLEFSYVIYPRYVLARYREGGGKAVYEKVPAEFDEKYLQYMAEGWVPLKSTSRYILFGKKES